jgi:hypothetical protein
MHAKSACVSISICTRIRIAYAYIHVTSQSSIFTCVCVWCVCVCVCVSLCVCRFVCVCICAIQPYSIQYTHHIMCKRLSSLNRSRAFASFTTKYTPHTEGGTQTPPHTHTHTQTLTGAKEGRNRSGVPLPGLPFILLLVHGDFRRQGPRGRRAKARDVLHP